jgi:hypothetical protein
VAGLNWNWWLNSLEYAFVDRLIQLSRMCEVNGLESVTVSSGPDQWDQSDELRLCGDSLIVTDYRFWFQAHPKHADFHVETQGVPINELIRAALSRNCVAVTTAGIFNDNFMWQDGVLYFANLPEELGEHYLSRDGLAATEGGDL